MRPRYAVIIHDFEVGALPLRRYAPGLCEIQRVIDDGFQGQGVAVFQQGAFFNDPGLNAVHPGVANNLP